MRVQVNDEDRIKFFDNLKKRLDRPWSESASNICGANPRTIRGWQAGDYTIPLDALNQLASAAEIPLPPIQNRLSRYWYVHLGAKQGAQRRYELYGNLGTPEGRRKGGLRSIQVNRKMMKPGFNVKAIHRPQHSARLAEFIGAVLGDGSLSTYQLRITLHRIDDKKYAKYIAELGKELFGISPKIKHRKDHNTIDITYSSSRLVKFLNRMGLPSADKVRNQVAVPGWIRASKKYSQACLRGLMDTDGCFYVDRHKYKNTLYLNPGLNFSNRSIPLLEFAKNTATECGFHPTQKTKYAIFLRREEEIRDYFKQVGSSNHKHKKKFTDYLSQKYGEVPKWS